jgi:hypothetical protein
VGFFKNGECTGRSIVIHDDEPEDDRRGQFRVLRKPPLIVIVEIPRDLGKLCGNTFPPNCIPVVPMMFSKIIKMKSACTMLQGDTTTGKVFTLGRMAHPLDCAIVFTDYFAQGQSFKGYPHFLHMGMKQGSYKQGNLLVPFSRPATFSDIKLLQPLWDPINSGERASFVRQLRNAVTQKDEAIEERQRLEKVAQGTITTYKQQLFRKHGFTEKVGRFWVTAYFVYENV